MSPGNQSGDRCIARSRCAEHTAVQSYTQKGPSFRDLPPPQAVDTRPSRPQLVHIYPSPALPPAAAARDWTDAQDSPSSAPSSPCSHADDDGLRGWAPARKGRGRVLDVAAGTVTQGALALPPTASAVEARPSRRGSPRRAGSAGALSRRWDGAVRRDGRRQTGSEHRAPRRPRELFRAGRHRAQEGASVSQGQAVGTVRGGAHCSRTCLHWGVFRLPGGADPPETENSPPSHGREYLDPLVFVGADSRPSVLLPVRRSPRPR